MLDSHAYRLLYEDDQGQVIGLHEVQLLDDPAPERVRGLRALLGGPDAFVAFQAAEVLTAWGDDTGLTHMERVVTEWPDEGRDYYPQRIWAYDNALDHVADAVNVWLLTVGASARATALLRQLLTRYGPVVFESRLKHTLLRRGDPVLASDVRAAIERADARRRSYLASQLLPVLARWEGTAALPLIERFLTRPDAPNPRSNVAEALRYVDPTIARLRLVQLTADPDSVVADEARRALDSC